MAKYVTSDGSNWDEILKDDNGYILIWKIII